MAENNLPNVLRKAREAAQMTQGQLADTLNINRWTYVAVEQGRGRFRSEWVRRLPMDIRKPVIECLLRQHEDAMAELRWWMLDRKPTRVTRPKGSVYDAQALRT